MSDITKGANIRTYGKTHAATRTLAVWSKGSSHTSEYQRTLCRSNQKPLGRWGAEVTSNPITCGNCLRIIARDEAEAHTMNPAPQTKREAIHQAIEHGNYATVVKASQAYNMMVEALNLNHDSDGPTWDQAVAQVATMRKRYQGKGYTDWQCMVGDEHVARRLNYSHTVPGHVCGSQPSCRELGR